MPASKTRAVTLIPILFSAVVLGIVLGTAQVGLGVALIIAMCFGVAVLPALLVANNYFRDKRE